MKEKGELFNHDELMKIIIDVPKKTFNLTLNVDCYVDGGVVGAKGVYDTEAIREARNMYLELDPDDDAFSYYVLTDKGKEMLGE